ncbi:MAG: sigma 54-interacting transcriptional regulator [Myxococcota bacterium]
MLPYATVETGAVDIPRQRRIAVRADVAVVFGPDRGRQMTIGDRVVVGRSRTSDLPLNDAGVSGEHFSLASTKDGIRIVDLGSRHGTAVNGESISETLVETRAIVRAGDSLITVQRSADTPWMTPSEPPLVGGAALDGVQRTIRLIGPTPLPVLVLGETGTGKEVVARMLHDASGRQGSFIAVNCAALPETLAEAELFGHTKAAFTGAQKASAGLFGAADKGTLFLDEVGELPASVQAKLLRVLEDSQVRPVGATTSRSVDVRIVSATNRNVRSPDGFEFRSDLLARLAVTEIELPPLRARREDVPALVEHFAPGTQVSPSAMEALCLHDWPMNVRELAACIRAAALRAGGAVQLEHLPPRIRERSATETRGKAPAQKAQKAQKRTDEASVVQALMESGGNVRQASAALGISRVYLYRLLKRFGRRIESFRAGHDEAGTGRAEAKAPADADADAAKREIQP